MVAVDQFHLKIHKGEFIVLVGPSGCGKSTVLRMIAGLENITKGELLLNGRLINDTAAKDRDIAMVFQNYALYPHMNVYQNMAFGLKMRKKNKPWIKEKIQLTAEQLQISDLLTRKPAELSGGQRQRVALGRAMVREPKIFLLDEPLSNLDAKLRTEMRLQISRLHQQLQTTFIYVTHDQTEAMTMADRIVVMKDSHIQQVGHPTEIYARPANVFVAGFIGSPQMNFLPLSTGNVFLREGDFQKRKAVDSGCQVGQELLIGVRPEDVLLETTSGDDTRTAIVEMKEEMGAETYYYLKFQGGRLTARLFGTGRWQVGDSVNIRLLPERLHFFDPETGTRLGDDT